MNWIETTIPGEGITRYDLIDDAGPEFPLATVHDNGGGGSWLWNATGGPVGWGLTESEAKRFAEEAVLSVQAEWEARHPRPKHPRGPRGRNAYGHNEKPEGGGMKPIRLTLPMPPSGNNRNEGTGKHTHHSANVDLRGEKCYTSSNLIRHAPALLVTAGGVSQDGVSVVTTPILSPDTPQLKRCQKCGTEYPSTPDYFYRKGGSLQSFCKSCARERDRQYRIDHADELQEWRKKNSAKRSAKTSEWNKNNPDRYAENCKRYRAAHPEKIKQIQRNDYLKNRELRIQYARDRYQIAMATNPDAVRARARESAGRYRAKHSDKVAAYRRLWIASNPEKVRAYWSRRRARVVNAGGDCTADDLTSIRAAQTNAIGQLICWRCGKPITDTPHLDHWIPLSKGGTNDAGNLHYMHARCNLSKGAKLPTEIGRLV